MRALSLGLLAGVLWLQSRAVLPPDALRSAAMILALVIIVIVVAGANASLRHRAVLSSCLLALAGALLGAGWAGSLAHHRLQQALPASLEGRDLIVTGDVRGLPETGATDLRFRFRPVSASLPDGTGVQLPHDLSLGWYRGHGRGQSKNEGEDDDGEAGLPVLQAGERWQLTVRLKRPHGLSNPGGFDAEAWMLNEGLRATGYVRPGAHRRIAAAPPWWQAPAAAVHRVRAAVRDKILHQLNDQPYAGVVVALVIGDQRAIERKDWDVFARTGIGHLVSISGLHITMISALLAALVHWLWRYSFFTRLALPLRLPAQKAAAMAGLLAALAYVALAGFGIPAQRTLLMLAVVSAALWSDRVFSVSQILCAALAVVLFCDPWSVLWPGFWLSFVAIGCILFATSGRAERPDASDGEQGDARMLVRPLFSLRSAARTQWVVTVGLLPLSLAWFAQVSLVGPVANAVAIPLVSFAVTPLSLLGSLLPAPLSGALLGTAHALMAWLADWLSGLAASPWAVWQAPQPDGLKLMIAMVGSLWALAPRGWPHRWAGLLTWLPLLLAPPDAPERGFRVTAFDIGQGNALLIETAHHRLVYDTGPVFSPESDGGSRVLLPALRSRGIAALDGLVISHSDNDHSGGARSLWEGVRVGWVSSSLPPEHPLLAGAPPQVPCAAGQVWVWDEVRFEMLHPTAGPERDALPSPNARSCTLKISYRGQAVLLAGDIEAAQERALVARAASNLQVDVLLAPHHGSGTSSTTAFLDAVRPSVALFQVGYRNRYRHPKPEVVARYVARQILPLRTDQSGAIRIEIDESLRVRWHRCERRRYWSAEPCVTREAMQAPAFAPG